MNATRRSYGTKEDLALALAEAVAEHLNDGIAARGQASIALSGGSTPGRFFSVLGRRKDIDWSRVTVTLVDERWVPETSDRSNAGLVSMHASSACSDEYPSATANVAKISLQDWAPMACKTATESRHTTASSLMFNVQAASQGAGQIRPVNSGKLFVEWRLVSARRHSS